MRAQEKNIRGFNLLELLVVIVIISVISAAAYPNFSSWRKEREVRTAATKIKNLFTNIYSQVQNGSFAFVQVEVINEGGDLAVISKGLSMDTLTQRVRNVDKWNSDITTRCDADQTGKGYVDVPEGWDEEGATREKIKDSWSTWSVSNNLQVGFLSFDDIVVNFDGETPGTICFSKDGTWYSADGEFESSNSIIEKLYICNGTSTITKCNVPGPFSPKPKYPIPGSEHKYVFEINWSRFGNVTMEKWNKKKNEWVVQ
jgi:prepilin-type N-terminal cleavage/methylation domain-containing protein